MLPSRVAVVVNVGMTNAFRFKRVFGQTMGHHAELSIQNRPRVPKLPNARSGSNHSEQRQLYRQVKVVSTVADADVCAIMTRPVEECEGKGARLLREISWMRRANLYFISLKCRIWHFNLFIILFYFVFFFCFYFFDLPQVL